MSEHWINIRFLFWHLQAVRGSLWAWQVTFNGWWWNRRVLTAPFAIYEFSPIEGWRARNNGTPKNTIPF